MSYKKKPVLIQVISLLYLFSPIGNLVMAVFFNPNLTARESIVKIYNLAFVQYNPVVIITLLLWAAAIPLAIGLYQVKIWSWYFFIVHAVVTFIVSFIRYKYNAAQEILFFLEIDSSSVVNALFLIPAGIFLHSEIRTPYFNPHLRWWQQKTRYKHEETITINDTIYKTYDISETGAFIVCPEIAHFKENQRLSITINLDDFHLQCNAQAIWENDGTNHYPKGYGIKFLDLKKIDKLKIKYFIKTLQLQGKEER